ncbi:hypothetical protein PSEUDO8BK_40671 [Pseudomonas sp. 8BK]|nr:hypothetical protein PSEUDO8BK_40671 [Pseudomonas sp. 8BK]
MQKAFSYLSNTVTGPAMSSADD